MQNFTDIIQAFGGPTKMAQAIEIPPGHAQTMKNRNSIPAAYWPAIVRAARERRIRGVTHEALAGIAKTRQTKRA